MSASLRNASWFGNEKSKKKKGILSSEGKNKGAKMKRQMALEGQKNREKIRLHLGN